MLKQLLKLLKYWVGWLSEMDTAMQEGVGAGRVSSSCTNGRRGPGLKRSELTPGPGPDGTSNAPTTGGHHPAGPRRV
jgi:hypothetical protein